jgi:hypothetical protein
MSPQVVLQLATRAGKIGVNRGHLLICDVVSAD